jgi:hypothetical protein
MHISTMSRAIIVIKKYIQIGLQKLIIYLHVHQNDSPKF